ncbi:type II toxin-antitoxin system RatA family toxin [Streptomyces sp. NPDC059785]|uniref:type II toxin-antitoxin system RatA family toxin n=1 Tax=unclassified Streptomyces TaxID=2593676 RepID=UPI0036524105
MRQVVLAALVPGRSPETVFDGVTRFERYPGLAPHVRATTVHAGPPGERGSSSWELRFRSGLLRWTETEDFDRAHLRIAFRQTDGDFDAFSGRWVLRRSGDGCALRFEARFDFGIPSMEGILDPIAGRVIRETVAWAVTGMFTGTVLGEETGTTTP